ncbi:MAG: TonB-dependent receptor [Candidatus Azobacteroides sp.]|nr:TonB-dependent receptor [Candidatus Azobacteroides sp.]
MFLSGSMFPLCIFSQEQITQTVRGIVTDADTGAPLSFITVAIPGIPEAGNITDESGNFVIRNVPVGRHSFQASSIGYHSNLIAEVLVTSSKEVFLEIPLKENANDLSEVVVSAYSKDDIPINKMTLVGGRMLSVEQASRYAGGLDDPARFVTAFAGVASSGSSNGISIHGNAPHLLQWRLEDIEIPNPNHFADITSLGGGILSSLSNKVLGNSDFLIAAFPSEYGNAVSGVFDMRLRNGNSQEYEHTAQVGILGLEFASEGPISKKNNSSYIASVRASTTGLMSKVFDMDLGGTFDYYDVNFKLNFPTRKAGTFSFWGTGFYDKYKTEREDPSKWEYFYDRSEATDDQYMAATGMTHRLFLNDNTSLKTTLAYTYSQFDATQHMLDFNNVSSLYATLYNRTQNMVASTSFNKKYSSRFTNKTGFTFQHMAYKMDLMKAPYEALPLESISQGEGNTNLISGYTSSSFDVNNRITFNFGINSQWLTLNDKWTLEPRASVKWKASGRSSWGLAYGLHSRMEKIDVYFVKTPATGNRNDVNKELDFTKAHHVMLSYNFRVSDDINIRVEPYFQYLYDVPVIADSSYSVLNRNDFFVEDALVNRGKGRNIGIDLTFEKYLSKGYYYMATATLFDSRYRGGDGKWYNTRFNRKYVLNLLGGKEWVTGKNRNKIWSVNLRGVLQGGDRYSPVDTEATLADPDKLVRYNEDAAYSKQFGPSFTFHYTVSYKINLKGKSHEFAIKVLDPGKEYYGHSYNYKTGRIDEDRENGGISNISYKFEF